MPASASPSPSASSSVTNSATSGSGNAHAQGVISQTSVSTQQTAQVQQGHGSTGNSVNLTVGIDANNQGQATAAAGNASATGMAGSTTFNATLTTGASAGQASTTAPGTASTTTSQTQTSGGTPTSAVATTVSVAASTSATATSGNATALGVNAQTTINGNQAVVVHIPANTSGQTIHVTLDASVQNTGTANSQSGKVQASALLNSAPGGGTTGAQQPGGNAISNTAAQSAGASGGHAVTNNVDVRDVNYALAESGDAMAIGVKADTVIDGVQRVLVIIDDNSSGNRIIITFQVTVKNTGSASASTGSTAALGRNGALQTPGGATSGSLTVDNSATALTGAATAIGVQANTVIGVNQDVILQAGQNSNNNEVDVDFEAAVANSGVATAQTGDSQALAQGGDVGPQPGTSTSKTNTLSTSVVAVGTSGATDATGVVAGTTLNEQQPVQVTVNNNNPLPISISQKDRVINLGFANSLSGAATVIARVDPPPAPVVDPPASPPASPSPSPSPSSDTPANPVSQSSPTVFRVANPPNFTVAVVPVAQPATVPAPAESKAAGATTAAVVPPPTVASPAPTTPKPAGRAASVPGGSIEQLVPAGDPSPGIDPAQAYSMVLTAWGDLPMPAPVAPALVTAMGQPTPGPKPTLPPFPAWSLVAVIPGILAALRGRSPLF